MSLRIAFDLDGVLADMESELVRQSEIAVRRGLTPRHGAETARPARRVRRGRADGIAGSRARLRAAGRSAQHDRAPAAPTLASTSDSIENFWEGLDEIEPGVVQRLATLAIDRRWEMIFLTKRPETAGATAQVQSQRWLEAKGFTLPSVFVVQGSRGRIAAALGLDIVVDDRPENCLDVVADSKARAILVWRARDGQPPAIVQATRHRRREVGRPTASRFSPRSTRRPARSLAS